MIPLRYLGLSPRTLLIVAVLVMLVEAVAVGYVLWRRRAREKGQDAAMALLIRQGASTRASLDAVTERLDTLSLETAALRTSLDALRAELDMFVHGPPSLRRPPVWPDPPVAGDEGEPTQIIPW